jgi:hypothetical protein
MPMPTAPFDVFAELDNAIMREGEEQMALDHWYRRSAEWDCCVDSVEDELVGMKKGC